ncbi:MAG: hypothetical protein ACE366_15520 [Bradymonadia bacterium]
MIFEALAVLYLGVGLGWAAAVICLKRPTAAEGFVEVALLVPFWPVYGPFMAPLSEAAIPVPASAQTPSEDAPLLHTLRLAQGAPLAALLPDEGQARRLVAQIEAAVRRVEEIDHLLADPDFCAESVQGRIVTLESAGRAGAARAARGNLKNIERLERLRSRTLEELDEVAELMRQLRLQAEVLRLSGERAGQQRGDLARALMARVEGLEGVLEDDVLGLNGASAIAP